MAKVKKKKNRPSKDDLRGPDEFQVKMAGFTPFLERNGGKILTGIIVLIAVVAAAYIGLKFSHSKKVENSAALQTKVEKVLQAAESNDKTAVETAVKTLSQMDTKGKPYAGAVALVAGSAYLKAGKFDLAAKQLKKALSAFGPNDPLYPYIQEALADTLIAKGNAKDALNVLQKSGDNVPVSQKAQLLLTKGDIFNPALVAKSGVSDPSNAAKTYKTAQDTLEKSQAETTDYGRFLIHMSELRLFTLPGSAS